MMLDLMYTSTQTQMREDFLTSFHWFFFPFYTYFRSYRYENSFPCPPFTRSIRLHDVRNWNVKEKPRSPIFFLSLTADPFSFSLSTANFNIHEDININKNININIDIYEYECRCVNIHGTEYYTRIESSRKAKRRGETREGMTDEGREGREGELQVQTIPGGLKGTPSTPIHRRYRQRSHSYKRRRKLSRW